jgi:hypothetical protein
MLKFVSNFEIASGSSQPLKVDRKTLEHPLGTLLLKTFQALSLEYKIYKVHKNTILSIILNCQLPLFNVTH